MVAGIEDCVRQIHAAAPQAKIAFIGTQPIPFSPRGKSVEAFAAVQERTCENLGIPYLDLYRKANITAENGRRFFSDDLLHMNDRGYKHIRNLQAEFIAQILGK